MSNATANWFLPTSTWKRLTQDYALVLHPATPIRRELRMHDRLPYNHYRNLQDYADDWYDHRYRFLPCGSSNLVYADCDQGSSTHQALVKRWAEQTEAETEDPSIVEEKAKLIAAARAKFDFVYGATDNKPISSDAAVLTDLRHQIGRERSWTIKYILKLPSRAAKESVLRLLSEQDRTKIVRPTMLVLDMLDSCQSSTAGETHGWVSGYDFLTNVLVIKPFVSRPDHHPLGDPWLARPVPNDGVSFRGSPQELVTLVTDDDHGFGPTASPAHPFSRLVRMEAASWVLEYAKALPIDTGSVEALASVYEEREDKTCDMYEATAFPNQRKEAPADHDEVKVLWEASLAGLESAEVEFRRAAVGARERGREGEVRNLVRVYERMVGELRALVEEPGR